MWQSTSPQQNNFERVIPNFNKSLSFDSSLPPRQINGVTNNNSNTGGGGNLSSSTSALPSKVNRNTNPIPAHLQKHFLQEKNRRRGVTVATSPQQSENRRMILLGNSRPNRQRSKSLPSLNTWDYVPFEYKSTTEGQINLYQDELTEDIISTSSSSACSSPSSSEPSSPSLTRSNSSNTLLNDSTTDLTSSTPTYSGSVRERPPVPPRTYPSRSLGSSNDFTSANLTSKLNYETTDENKFIVVSGPKDQLVEYLCNKNKIDSTFGNTFILTFRYFIHPIELFNQLITKYESKVPYTSSAKVSKQYEEILERVRQNVLIVLSLWVESNFSDFLEDQYLYDKLIQFTNDSNSTFLKDSIDKQKISKIPILDLYSYLRQELLVNLSPRNSGSASSLKDKEKNQFFSYQTIIDWIMNYLSIGKNTADSIFKKLLKLKVIGSMGGAIVANVIKSQDSFFFVNNSNPKKEIYSRSFLDYSPQDIANQLTLLEFKMFQGVKMKELYYKSWTVAKTKFEQSPNVMALITMSNKIANWVATEVVTTPHPKKRVEVVKRFISIAEHCKKINNFNTLMEIISGLNNSSVSRLKETWKSLPTRYTNSFNQLQNFLKTDENWKLYRQAVKSKEVPCLPYMGLFLQDINFVEDGNSNIVEDEHNYINFKKMTLLSNILSEIQYFQKHPYYSFQTNTYIQTFIEKDIVILPDKELYAFSKFVESPTNPLNKFNKFIV
ncbi:hypothetical protein CYY_005001 [Polysphondylium violaceum]|uniref:Ras guanine nucleotide exchange factor n=1 Tax=Polysphondylium violaceum TaxID=133409 RepID=A0A8J4PVU8_9MYCE|nr:hypothetical protein CYY_005001 [Polysphondylium violaceum]